jgi:spore coat polysaccharide biosynthesis protein SpsF
MKTLAIIQARMGSTRLPGKVLQDIAGKPMLVRVVDRVRRAKTVDEIVIAITDLPQDDILEQQCLLRGWLYYRGSEKDVLDRYYRAVAKFGAEVIIRITSDCPLIDPDVIDQVVLAYQASPLVDYASNVLPPRTFPRGLDTEVFGAEVLKRLWQECTDPILREHVALFIHKNLAKFKTRSVRNMVDQSEQRWTVDTPEDLRFIRNIYEKFGNREFTWQNVLTLLDQNPDWHTINAHIQQKAT